MSTAFPIADHWFERRRVDDGLILLWEPFVDPLVRCNIWHIRGRDRDLLIDMGMGIVSLRDELLDLLERPVAAVVTHGHFDHVGSWHEFEDRVAHPLEPQGRAGSLSGASALVPSTYDPAFVEVLAAAGYPLSDFLVTAVPYEAFDVASFEMTFAASTRTVEHGDLIDLGDRAFEVLHLPGHSPGSIGLWEAATGTLFSGDAIYDGPLLDEVCGADIDSYVATMQMLRSLPVEVVHGGHDPSFGRDRFVEIIDHYLDRRASTSR
jgi:glyoxylase-like metal-dependent hydrolase (beta-lactamase superfamily II)